jgi:hypothetical protein
MQNFIPRTADPDAIARRLIQRAHNRDGLPEIAIGLSFLLVSGLIFVQVLLPRGSNGFKLAALALALLIPLVCFASPSALRWVRRRFLIARVGYVEPRPIAPRRLAWEIACGALVVAVFFGILGRVSRPDGWVLAGTGLFGGALMAWCGRLPRFVVGGAVMAAAGLVAAFAGVSLEMGFTMLFGFEGLAILVSGVVVLLRFMRQPVESGE